MTDDLDKSWHLAETQQEVDVTEFEFHLWRVFYGFTRWQEDLQRYICGDDLTAAELALLHVIRMKDRPKTIYELSRLLNRDDPNNIQYTITKLIKQGLIEKVVGASQGSAKRAASYQITALGTENTNKYNDGRKAVLIKLFEGSDLNLSEATKALISAKAIYDEASRLAASYTDKH
jgi:predicted MarR family transcription regulator